MADSIITELIRPFDCPDIGQLDIQALRSAFAELMDEAAGAAHAAGLELDECLLERYADVRLTPGGEIRTVEVDGLSERDVCIRAILDQCAQPEGGSGAFQAESSGNSGGDADGADHDAELRLLTPSPIAVVALRLRLIRGGMLDPFGFTSPSA